LSDEFGLGWYCSYVISSLHESRMELYVRSQKLSVEGVTYDIKARGEYITKYKEN